APGEDGVRVAEGRVGCFTADEGGRPRVHVRDVRDLLGRPALGRNRPLDIGARVVEESILYGLDWHRVRRLLADHDDARNYVNRHLFWATRIGSSADGRPEIEASSADEGAIAGRAKNILQAHLAGGRLIEPRAIERLLT